MELRPVWVGANRWTLSVPSRKRTIMGVGTKNATYNFEDIKLYPIFALTDEIYLIMPTIL